MLAPAEVSHYPENNGKAKTELKDQTELGEKLVFSLQILKAAKTRFILNDFFLKTRKYFFYCFRDGEKNGLNIESLRRVTSR